MIKNSDISKAAKIDPSKLAPATKEGEVLLSQEQGKFASVKLSGDVTINKDGIVRIKNLDGITKEIQNYRDELDAEAGRQDTITKADLKEGKTLMGGAAGPEEVAVGSGANAIPQRDSSGNLNAETADQATSATNADNATLLNGNNMEYYRNVANHVSQTATTSTDSNNNDSSHQKTPHKVFEFDVPSDSGSYSAAGTSTSNYPIEFTHDCGYIPDVSVYYKSNSAGESDPWQEVDAEVQNTTTTTKVQISIQGANLKIVAK